MYRESQQPERSPFCDSLSIICRQSRFVPLWINGRIWTSTPRRTATGSGSWRGGVLLKTPPTSFFGGYPPEINPTIKTRKFVFRSRKARDKLYTCTQCKHVPDQPISAQIKLQTNVRVELETTLKATKPRASHSSSSRVAGPSTAKLQQSPIRMQWKRTPKWSRSLHWPLRCVLQSKAAAFIILPSPDRPGRDGTQQTWSSTVVIHLITALMLAFTPCH